MYLPVQILNACFQPKVIEMKVTIDVFRFSYSLTFIQLTKCHINTWKNKIVSLRAKQVEVKFIEQNYIHTAIDVQNYYMKYEVAVCHTVESTGE